MKQTIRILPYLDLHQLQNPVLLQYLYQNMIDDYYWSDDFSPRFYAAQARAGFMAVTEVHKGQELLLPELQKSYAVLDFVDLHISKKVRKLIKKNRYTLHAGLVLDPVAQKIREHHLHSWLSPRYLQTLKSLNSSKLGITVIAVSLRHEGIITAGEIGYIIGSTYTSLSGFASREKKYRNSGTLQLVLLAKWLQKNNFAFWNLGQPYMPYKFAIGAKKISRDEFLARWQTAIDKNLRVMDAGRA